MLLPVLTEVARRVQGDGGDRGLERRRRPSSGQPTADLPLLQEYDVVQCGNCKRMLLRSVMEAHRLKCAQLPIDKLLAADAATQVPAGSHNKSPNRPNSRTGSGGRNSTGPDDGSLSGAPPAAKRQDPWRASGARPGRSGPRPLSAEAEQRRLMFERRAHFEHSLRRARRPTRSASTRSTASITRSRSRRRWREGRGRLMSY